jgi:hypothetical protein
MSQCFVIQPFDGGAFDKRFDDVLLPAINDAGLSPYRVDRDPSVTVPIDAIEGGIRDAAACLVDITTNNPNVWFELGFALACKKPVVLICSAERQTRFPFDIQHRHIITYKTESTSDFEALRSDVAERLRAAMSKEAQVQTLAQSTLKETEGLEPHEIAALVIVAESDLDPDSYPSAYSLKQDMSRAGFTDVATVLAINALQRKRLVTHTQVDSAHREAYLAYCLTEGGRDWLAENRARLVLTKASGRVAKDGAFEDDDLPF